MAAMPSPTSGHEEHAILVSQCLDFCQTMAGKSLTFSFSLTLPTGFSFSVDTMGKGALASQKMKKKKPTPSTMRRNARRREEFLKKKVNASTDGKSQSEPVSVEEAEVPPSVLHHHPSPSPSLERRQVITVGREKARPTFSQLDGDPPSSPGTDSGSEQKTRSLTKCCALCPKEKPCRLNGDLIQCDHCTKGNSGRYFYCLSCL